MHFLIFTLFINILASAPAFANVETQTSKKVSPLKKQYTQISASYIFWQEKLEAVSNGTAGYMMTHFHGFKLGYAYNKPFNNIRWVQSYLGEASMGYVKGAGTSAAIPDEVESQTWMGLSFSPGLIYRTTANSEIGFALPLSYKKPLWKFETPLEVDDHPFSVGLSLNFISRLNLKSAITLGLTHQHMWNATIWSVGWQYDFRKK